MIEIIYTLWGPALYYFRMNLAPSPQQFLSTLLLS